MYAIHVQWNQTYGGQADEGEGGHGQDAGEVTRSRALTLFPGMAMVAGLLGGMLGIGGGMIMNPLLIETGMHPQV